MLRITSGSLTDFFEKLIFNAQCLYGTVLQRPLEHNDIVGLYGSNTQNTFNAVYVQLTHNEQKEILKAILSSKPLFDEIVDRLHEVEKNVVEWNKDLSISDEKLNELIYRNTYEAINFILKKFAMVVCKTSPQLFQKFIILMLNVGVDVEKIVESAAKSFQEQLKIIKETEKKTQQFLDDLYKSLPPQQPPHDEELPPEDGEEDKGY